MYDIITPEIEKEIKIDIELKIKRYIVTEMYKNVTRMYKCVTQR